MKIGTTMKTHFGFNGNCIDERITNSLKVLDNDKNKILLLHFHPDKRNTKRYIKAIKQADINGERLVRVTIRKS